MEHSDGIPDLAREVRALWASGRRDEAFAQVVAATGDALYRYLVSFLRDEEAAREVFQDTYLRVFRGLGGFRGDARLSTWVLRIGRNAALNRIRHRNVRAAREVPLESTEEPLEARGGGQNAETRSVAAALEALPDVQREVVLLYYGEEFSVAEVALATGRPENTVKSDLLRARRALREMLERSSDTVPTGGARSSKHES